MRKSTAPIALLAVAAFALAACGPDEGPKTNAGTVIGAIVGGVAGSAFGRGGGKVAAAAAGTFIGGVLGHNIGRSLDKADQAYAQHAVGHGLENQPTGQPTEWRNPDSGNQGTVTPTRTYQTPAGRYCREYQHTVTVGGKTETAYGTACRQPDGTWEIQSS